MSATDHHRAYRGDFVETPSPGKLDIFEDYRLGSSVDDLPCITSHVNQVSSREPAGIYHILQTGYYRHSERRDVGFRNCHTEGQFCFTDVL